MTIDDICNKQKKIFKRLNTDCISVFHAAEKIDNSHCLKDKTV